MIDDDTLVLTSLEAILTEWRYEVIAAISAEEAVAQVRNAGRRLISCLPITGYWTDARAPRRSWPSAPCSTTLYPD